MPAGLVIPAGIVGSSLLFGAKPMIIVLPPQAFNFRLVGGLVGVAVTPAISSLGGWGGQKSSQSADRCSSGRASPGSPGVSGQGIAQSGSNGATHSGADGRLCHPTHRVGGATGKNNSRRQNGDYYFFFIFFHFFILSARIFRAFQKELAGFWMKPLHPSDPT